MCASEPAWRLRCRRRSGASRRSCARTRPRQARRRGWRRPRPSRSAPRAAASSLRVLGVLLVAGGRRLHARERCRPGQTAFARIPCGAPSAAKQLGDATTPALVTEYAAISCTPRMPASEAMVTIEPPPCSRIRPKHARAQRKTPVRLTSSSSRKTGSGVASSGPPIDDPGVRDEHVEPPARGRERLVHRAVASRAVAGVALDERRPRRSGDGLAALSLRPVKTTVIPSAGGARHRPCRCRRCHR